VPTNLASFEQIGACFVARRS